MCIYVSNYNKQDHMQTTIINHVNNIYKLYNNYGNNNNDNNKYIYILYTNMINHIYMELTTMARISMTITSTYAYSLATLSTTYRFVYGQ